MNPIQKAATVVVALTITLVGATLATAPLALANWHSTPAHGQSYRQVMACAACASLSGGAVGAVDR